MSCKKKIYNPRASSLRDKWRLDEWNEKFSRERRLPPMTKEEIAGAIDYLRGHYYPKPEDCPVETCEKYRPACKLGICVIAVGMCGDF
jgi:hypothetical protein